MKLILHAPGASTESLARGVAAAQAVFNDARLTAAEAALASWACAEWRRSGLVGARPPEGIIRASMTFERAQAAAIAACCPEHAAASGSRLEVAGL